MFFLQLLFLLLMQWHALPCQCFSGQFFFINRAMASPPVLGMWMNIVLYLCEIIIANYSLALNKVIGICFLHNSENLLKFDYPRNLPTPRRYLFTMLVLYLNSSNMSRTNNG